MNLNKILCSDCRAKLKAVKRAEKCVKKLKANPGATFQQKQSWKYHIAKSMRLNPTPAEQLLKEIVENWKELANWQTAYQKQIGPYIVDCCIVNRDLVIEVDGPIHATQREYDRARDLFLDGEGFKVLHLQNDLVMEGWIPVLEAIQDVLRV